MKKFSSFALAIAAMALLGCSEEHLKYTSLGLEGTDYSGATEGREISLNAEAAQSDYFEEVSVALSAATTSSVLYAYTEDGTTVYGKGAYTSEEGFYFDKDGYVCSPADEDARLYVDLDATNKALVIGQVPEVCKAGDEYTLHFGITTTKTYYPITLTVDITEAGSWCGYIYQGNLVYDVYEQVKTDYTPCKIPIDATALCNALGMSSASAIAKGIANNTVTFIGLNADGSEYTAGSTANNSGHWFNSSGDVCSWKADNWFAYAEWDNTAPIIFGIGQAVSGVEVGMSATLRQKFVYGSNEAIVTWNLHIVDTVPDDATIPEE